MKTTTRLGIGVVGMLSLLVGGGWLGRQVKPKPFEPHWYKTPTLDTVGLLQIYPGRFASTSGGHWARGYRN